MRTLTINLPGPLRQFVDLQVVEGGYGTRGHYIRELIRKDQARLRMRGMLRAGAASPSGPEADGPFFGALRQGIPGKHEGAG